MHLSTQTPVINQPQVSIINPNPTQQDALLTCNPVQVSHNPTRNCVQNTEEGKDEGEARQILVSVPLITTPNNIPPQQMKEATITVPEYKENPSVPTTRINEGITPGEKDMKINEVVATVSTPIPTS